MNVAIAAKNIAEINILLPPILSASAPVVTFPIRLPAVPHPRIAPNVAVSILSVGSASMAGPATPTTVLHNINSPYPKQMLRINLVATIGLSDCLLFIFFQKRS